MTEKVIISTKDTTNKASPPRPGSGKPKSNQWFKALSKFYFLALWFKAKGVRLKIYFVAKKVTQCLAP